MSMTEKGRTRADWLIHLDAKKILAAAKTKQKHHTERLDIWKKAQTITEDKILKEGVSIDRSVLEDLGKMSYSNSGRSPQAVIRDDLLRDLTEASSKIHEHQGKLREFDSWVEFLEFAEGELSLNLADYLYFFGK